MERAESGLHRIVRVLRPTRIGDRRPTRPPPWRRRRAQTPISVAGTIDGDRLTLTFTERGTRRPTQGKFVLLLDESGAMRGRFSSNAARSSGTVEARRIN